MPCGLDKWLQLFNIGSRNGLVPSGNKPLLESFDEMLWCHIRTDSRFAPSQWETALLCNGVSHWLGARLGPALHFVSPGTNVMNVTLWLKCQFIHACHKDFSRYQFKSFTRCLTHTSQRIQTFCNEYIIWNTCRYRFLKSHADPLFNAITDNTWFNTQLLPEIKTNGGYRSGGHYWNNQTGILLFDQVTTTLTS